jgi:hypothetical protein
MSKDLRVRDRHEEYLEDFQLVENTLCKLKDKYKDNEKVQNTYKAFINMFFYTTDLHMAFIGKKAEIRHIQRLWRDTTLEFEELKIEFNKK